MPNTRGQGFIPFWIGDGGSLFVIDMGEYTPLRLDPFGDKLEPLFNLCFYCINRSYSESRP
jgi:hypothetical protein